MRYDMNIFSNGEIALVSPFMPANAPQPEAPARANAEERGTYYEEMNFVARLLMWMMRNER